MIVILLISLLGIASNAYSGQAILTWDAPTTNADGTPLTDLAGYKVYYGTASRTYGTPVDVGNITTYTVNNLSENATYYFAVIAYDLSGNESSYSNEVFKTIPGIQDTTPPAISGVTASSITSTGAVITWTTDEASNSQVEYGTTTSYGSSTPIDNTMVTSHSVTLSGLTAWTTYHFMVKSQDVAGNLATSADYTFTTLTPPDTTPPTGTISINNGATYTTLTTVTLTLSCSDSSSGCSQMRFSNDNATWSSWETYATSKSWTLTSGDGTKTVYAQYRDNAGNGSISLSDTIGLDTAAPSGTISNSSGATYTSSTAVTLTLSCNDSGTGCNQMRFSNNNSTWSSWETYATSKNWTLTSGDGTKTVYAQYRDNAGNSSSSLSDTITLDTTAPAISAIVSGNITDTGATISWTTGETATTQVEYGTSTGYGSSTPIDTNLVTSHNVSLTGLSPSTTYHFRVLSRDAAGNLATSADYTFSTLASPQPDTPASIMDLRIRAGFSTRNSVILDWSATGADGTEGTASMYDLRISILKIIEDGITSASGEINFSNATRITSLPAPQVAGTAESFQIGQLVTNSVYYFALKAIDDKGNLSAISNVVNGGNVPPQPVTAVRNGYTMISFPLIPSTTDVQALLGGIVGNPVELYRWNSSGPGDNNGAFVAETNIVPGYGYFLKSNIDTAVLNVTGTIVMDASRTIPLQPGWNMIGNPYPAEVVLRNTYIRKIDTGELKSYEDAVIAGWIGNAIYRYNGSTYDLDLYSEGVLKLWQGYWIAVLQNGQYEMIIYKP